MEKDVVSSLKEITVDEQLTYISQLNDSSRTDDMESIIQSSMTDEDLFNYLVKQDKGIMTMDEFEELVTKTIRELFP